MKYSLVSILRCPECAGELGLKVFNEITQSFEQPSGDGFKATRCPHASSGDCEKCRNKDITDGLLECSKCEIKFPIVNSVPRLLPDSIQRFPDFSDKWKTRIGAVPSRARKDEREYRQVVKHFQTQWRYWGRKKRSFGRDIDKSLNYLLWTMSPKGSTRAFFKNKLILDAGCGHGKFLAALANEPAESVGIDITLAIDLCQDLVGKKGNVHLIQGDIIHPPLAPEAFDYVYSSGVIHHTPNTRKAFTSLARLVKKNAGVFSVWVYPFRQKWWEVTQGTLRGVTTRLPTEFLRLLCYIPVPLLSVPKLGAYSGTDLSNSSWSECAQVVFDFYGPKYQTHHTEEEVQGWFKQEGYGSLETGPDPTSVTGIKHA